MIREMEDIQIVLTAEFAKRLIKERNNNSLFEELEEKINNKIKYNEYVKIQKFKEFIIENFKYRIINAIKEFNLDLDIFNFNYSAMGFIRLVKPLQRLPTNLFEEVLKIETKDGIMFNFELLEEARDNLIFNYSIGKEDYNIIIKSCILWNDHTTELGYNNTSTSFINQFKSNYIGIKNNV